MFSKQLNLKLQILIVSDNLQTILGPRGYLLQDILPLKSLIEQVYRPIISLIANNPTDTLVDAADSLTDVPLVSIHRFLCFALLVQIGHFSFDL